MSIQKNVKPSVCRCFKVFGLLVNFVKTLFNLETLQFVKNSKGQTTGIFIDITKIKSKTSEAIEDLEDITAYELRKGIATIDFESFVKKANAE
jgi:hypothetical protein